VDALKQSNPVPILHDYVGQHQIERVPFEKLKSLSAGGRHLYVVSLALQRGADHGADVGFVIYHHNSCRLTRPRGFARIGRYACINCGFDCPDVSHFQCQPCLPGSAAIISVTAKISYLKPSQRRHSLNSMTPNEPIDQSTDRADLPAPKSSLCLNHLLRLRQPLTVNPSKIKFSRPDYRDSTGAVTSPMSQFDSLDTFITS
jgi:hypothetical protein